MARHGQALHPDAKHPNRMSEAWPQWPLDKRFSNESEFRESVLATQATQLYKTQTGLRALANSLTDLLNHVVQAAVFVVGLQAAISPLLLVGVLDWTIYSC